jgi:hypothetical protein
MKTLLSLFDYSGNWSNPFYDAGWEVIRWDIKLADFMNINLIEDAECALDMFEDVDGIIAGVPCTDFASSGARWFADKDETGETEKSKELVRQVLRLVDLFRPTDPDYEGSFFWAIENPVGRINTLFPELGEAYWFDPFEFAGWLSPSSADLARLDEIRMKEGHNVSKEEAQFILTTNAYTKHTGLWGEFNRNMRRKPVAPVKGSQWGTPLMRKGGKTAQTKEIRSNTPEGFARAFYEANKNYNCLLTGQLDLFA